MSKVQLAGNANGTGIFTIASPNSNVDRTVTLPDATGTVQVSGNPISGTTGTFSGLIYANGGGVQFPATQVPSADANCLDDYEEGTFTPTWNGGAVTVIYCAYTKIGRFVHANYDIQLAASGSSSASSISLPFTASPSVFYTGVFNYNSVSASQTVNIDVSAVFFRSSINSSVVACSAVSGARLIFSVMYYA